jgi:hypothetical protein
LLAGRFPLILGTVSVRLGIMALLVTLAACGSSSASSHSAASASSQTAASASSQTATSDSGHCGPPGATTMTSSFRANVVVRRLTDGRTLSEFPATARNAAEGLQSVRSLALGSNGAVAWIGSVHSIVGGHSLIEVHAADAPGSTDKVLDSGPGIDAASLRLHGSTRTWKDGATTRRATVR